MSPRTMRTDDDLSAEARITAAEMSRLLEYDSDEEQEVATTATEEDSTDSPKPPSPILKSNTSGGGVLDAWVDGETNWTTGSELDSVTLLKRLGSNPTETEMARIAVTRARESISDCFSVRVGKKCSFEEIPSYSKDELMIGQHLGKGSFSDVFEVMVTQKALSSKAVIKATIPEDIETLANSDGRRKPQRRSSMSGSVCVGSMGRPQFENARQGKRMTLAMKCLRPQARSNFDHFLVGVEDLIHETAILSTLDHPNIIKLWGRAGDTNSFKLSDGYFILVDKLQDTLQDRIDRWAKDYPNARKNAPSLNRIKVACDISDALSYLHMGNIVFRDLKPANVGFDASGQLKLFDFGFAASIASISDEESGSVSSSHSKPKLLHGKCGTLRYMAPEVNAALGYGKEVDVYSFGILLWEICAARKPFSNVKSAEDFENKVFRKEERPKPGKYWPEYLKDLMQKCWSCDPKERPTMCIAKSLLSAALSDMKTQSTQNFDSNSMRKSFFVPKRLTWNI